MPPASLSTQQVAESLGVPYTTLLKWQTTDGLLRPSLGLGGRRGGDRWSRSELELARVVMRLRDAGLPLRFIKAVLVALRSHRGPKAEVAVYVSVHVRERRDDPERRISLLRVEQGDNLRDATQLSCL